MRHNVHLFLGSELTEAALSLKRYILKYGETISPYFNAYVVEDGVMMSHVEHLEPQVDVFNSSLNEDKDATMGAPQLFATDDELQTFFMQLFTNIVTITDPGSDPALLLTVYLPMYQPEVLPLFKKILEATRLSQRQYEIDVIGIGYDLHHLFDEETDSDNDDDASTLQQLRQHQLQLQNELLELKQQDENVSFNHFIPLSNINSAGYALKLDRDSLGRILGEMAFLFISHYNDILRGPKMDEQHTVTAMGLSVLHLDENYFAQYLMRKAFLHVLNREQVAQPTVDLNRIAPIAQSCLHDPGLKRDLTHRFSQLLQENNVEDMLSQNMSEAQIVAKISPKISQIFDEELPQMLQGYIKDTNLSLPERKCILALILGLDDEQFTNDLFNDHQLYLDDIIGEPLQLFVDEDNRHIEKFKDDDGEEHAIHMALSDPEDYDLNIYVPLDDIRNVKKQMLSSSKYIRELQKDLDSLEQEKQDEHDSKRRLTDKGFEIEGTVYHVQHKVTEHALEEDYKPHDNLKPSVNLKEWFSPIRDQGINGACSAFAVVSVFEYFMHRYNLPSHYDLSPAFAYYNARARVSEPVANEGSSLYNNIEAMHDMGVCVEEKWPYMSATIDAKPDQSAYDDAKQRKIIKAMNVQIDVDPDKTLKNMKSALTDGLPVLISLRVFDSFHSPTGFVPLPTLEERAEDEEGWHALVLCGYSDEHKFFIARNSWGTHYGDNGYCYIPYSYVSNPELCPSAFVISEVTPNSESAGKLAPATVQKVAFNTADNAIRYAISNNLIFEEKRHLKKMETRYANLRADFDRLFLTLRNNTVRSRISDAARDRLMQETDVANTAMSKLQEERINALSEHKKESRSTAFALGGCALSFLLLAGLAFYYNWNEFHKGNLNFIAIFSCIAAILLVILGLYISYHHSRHKTISQEYQDRIAALATQNANRQRELTMCAVKFHLAGTFLDRYNDLRNELMAKYHCMVSFVGNLKTWHDEEAQKIEDMNPETQVPFMAVLDNDTLNNYFEQHLKKDVVMINLADFFNNNYTMDEDGIIKFQKNIRDKVKIALISKLDEFTMYDYITQSRNYPYLRSGLVSADKLLPQMENRSRVFTQYQQPNDFTPDVKYILLKTETTQQRNNWLSIYPQYFRNRPNECEHDSRFRLTVVEVKELKPDELIV